MFGKKRTDAELIANVDPNDPDKVWDKLKGRHTQKVIDPKSSLLTTYPAPKPEGNKRIVILSDTHSLHDRLGPIPEGDILIHAGDFSNVGSLGDCEGFGQFLASLPHPHKVVIAGNHDVSFDREGFQQGGLFDRFHRRYRLDRLPPEEYRQKVIPFCTYLEDQLTEVDGLKIYGMPWQPEFCDWAFNLQRGPQMQEKVDLIPNDIDILVSHGPPLGFLDATDRGNRTGSAEILLHIKEKSKPKLVIFGHIHEGYGVMSDGTRLYINASNCTIRYGMAELNPPIILDYPFCSAAL